MTPADVLAWDGRPGGAPWVAVTAAPRSADTATTSRLAALLRGARRPLVIAGPQHDPSLALPLAALARAIGAPLLADPLSQLRWGAHDRSMVIDGYDAALRHDPTSAALGPDVVLRVGGVPTSKPLQQFLLRHAAARQIVVDEARWPDPMHLAAEMVRADPRRLAEALVDVLPGGSPEPMWLGRWRRVNAVAGGALADYAAALDEPFEGRALAELTALVPPEGTLFVSSSMPVRDLDSFARGDSRPLRILANRGANGIDGVVSTALGAAAARGSAGGPLVLAIGDVAFYHDMNGLLAGRLHGIDATIVVLNNDGGGIFSFLPQAAHPAHFEQLFGTPHGLTFAPAAELYGASYRRATTWEDLRAAVSAGVSGHGLHLVEMATDRQRNVTLHREAWAAVAEALEAERGRGAAP